MVSVIYKRTSYLQCTVQNHYVGMAVFTRNGDNDHDKHVITAVEDGCIARYLQFHILRISFCFHY